MLQVSSCCTSTAMWSSFQVVRPPCWSTFQVAESQRLRVFLSDKVRWNALNATDTPGQRAAAQMRPKHPKLSAPSIAF